MTHLVIFNDVAGGVSNCVNHLNYNNGVSFRSGTNTTKLSQGVAAPGYCFQSEKNIPLSNLVYSHSGNERIGMTKAHMETQKVVPASMIGREETLEKSTKKHIILLLPYDEDAMSSENEPPSFHYPINCPELSDVSIIDNSNKKINFFNPVLSMISDNNSNNKNVNSMNNDLSSWIDSRIIANAPMRFDQNKEKMTIQYAPVTTSFSSSLSSLSSSPSSSTSIPTAIANSSIPLPIFLSNDGNRINESKMPLQMTNDGSNSTNSLTNEEHLLKIGCMLNINSAIPQQMPSFTIPDTSNYVVFAHTFNNSNPNTNNNDNNNNTNGSVISKPNTPNNEWNSYLDILPPPMPPAPFSSTTFQRLSLQTNDDKEIEKEKVKKEMVAKITNIKKEQQDNCLQSVNSSTCGNEIYLSNNIPPMLGPTGHRMVKRCCHVSEKKFFCNVCGKKYKYETNLITHAKVHTEHALECPYCHKKFGRKTNYVEHLRIHTNERPYKCRYCDKTFKQNHGWRDHERTHTNERPHVCEVCGKGFAVGHNLTVHKRIHTGEKPYGCDHCEKRFRQKSAYNAHVKNIHRIFNHK